jgi:hypothetical protein
VEVIRYEHSNVEQGDFDEIIAVYETIGAHQEKFLGKVKRIGEKYFALLKYENGILSEEKYDSLISAACRVKDLSRANGRHNYLIP